MSETCTKKYIVIYFALEALYLCGGLVVDEFVQMSQFKEAQLRQHHVAPDVEARGQPVQSTQLVSDHLFPAVRSNCDKNVNLSATHSVKNILGNSGKSKLLREFPEAKRFKKIALGLYLSKTYKIESW